MSYCVEVNADKMDCVHVCIWDVTHIRMCMYCTACSDPVLWVEACDVLLC